MPKYVDHAERRREITDAAVRILARGGASALTLRSLADELGGSITLITHFFANRDDLFDGIVDDLIATYRAELEELESGASPEERLHILLQWMLPLDEESTSREAGRIALVPHASESESIQRFFDVMEDTMRRLFAEHIAELGLGIDAELGAAYLRAVINGIVLSRVEHPGLWPEERQQAVLDIALNGLTALGSPAQDAAPAGHPRRSALPNPA